MSFNFRSMAALLVSMAINTVLGHGHVQGVACDGVYYPGFSLDYYYSKENTGTFPESVGWWAEDLDNGFISPDAYNTSDIICHLDAQPANLTATVKAGGTVTFYWTSWGHPGPVITYVAKCDDCTSPTLDKTALEWVKIDEGGFDVPSQTWAAYDLAANNNSWTLTVPSTLETGNYVFRHEIIAVHGSESLDGAQNYPQCLNIAITGGGSASPSGTLGTELYHETDPGIYFNPYTTLLNYTIPGPSLMEGGTNQTVTATSGAAAVTSTYSSSSSDVTSVITSSTTTSPAAETILVSSSTVSSSSAVVATSSTATSTSTVSIATATSKASNGCRRRRHARDVAV